MRKLSFVFVLLFMPALLWAQTSTTSTVVDPSLVGATEISGVIALMAKAFSDGNWRLAAGFLLTLAVAGFKLLGLNKLIAKKNNKWVAGVLALATSVAVGLMSGVGWLAIASTGLGVGVTAVGGWDLILEPVMKWLKKKWPKRFGWFPTSVEEEKDGEPQNDDSEDPPEIPKDSK